MYINQTYVKDWNWMSVPSALPCLEAEIGDMGVNNRHGRGCVSKCSNKKGSYLGVVELHRSLKKSKISSTLQ